jgi:hypothetical protein
MCNCRQKNVKCRFHQFRLVKINGFVLRYGWTRISHIGTSYSVRNTSAAPSYRKFAFIKNDFLGACQSVTVRYCFPADFLSYTFVYVCVCVCCTTWKRSHIRRKTHILPSNTVQVIDESMWHAGNSFTPLGRPRAGRSHVPRCFRVSDCSSWNMGCS